MDMQQSELVGDEWLVPTLLVVISVCGDLPASWLATEAGTMVNALWFDSRVLYSIKC